MMLTQRMAKNANTMLAENVVDPEVAFLLGKDTNTFRDTLQGLLQGNAALRIARVEDAETARQAGRAADRRSREYQTAVSNILGNQARLVGAKRASFDMFNDSEALLRAAENAERRPTSSDLGARRINLRRAGAWCRCWRCCVLLLIGRVYIDDSRRRADGERAAEPRPTRRRSCGCWTRSATSRTAT